MFSNIWHRMTSNVTIAAQIATGSMCSNYIQNLQSLRTAATIYKLRKTSLSSALEKPKKKNILDGKPMAKGIILRTLVKKPKKPNSANRKCVLLKLSTGKQMVAYVPGEGHNLQEHQAVLVRIDKLQDVPGVKLTCIRGKYDLPHVKK